MSNRSGFRLNYVSSVALVFPVAITGVVAIAIGTMNAQRLRPIECAGADIRGSVD